MKKIPLLLAFVASLALLAILCGPSVLKEGQVPKELSFLAPSMDKLPSRVEEVKPVFAPNVPPPIDRKEPAVLVVRMETREEVGVLAPGIQEDTKYTFWTFDGQVPGPFLRARVGDVLELHLKNNSTSTMPHNIDLHAATGTGGGASLTTVAPGQEKVVRLGLLNPGLFIYHCAVPPVPAHMANGMYGLILVEPEGGLPRVDREFYVMQSEFYTREPFGYEGLTHLDLQKGMDEQPTYIVFNGRVGSLMNENALEAKAGETVRIFFGVGGPNKASNFHVIGEIFDRVWPEGSTGQPMENVQTTLVPPGGATVVEFRLDVPGIYTLVDHAIFRLAKGAVGQLKVTGAENPLIYGTLK